MEEKQCFVCGIVKPLDDFYKHAEMSDGHLNKCKECTKQYIRNRDTRKIDIKRYRNNPDRYLKHKYHMIKRRCIKDLGHHKTYIGREFLSEDQWDFFCNQNRSTFMRLYKDWQDSGYDRWKSPSIDRIDNTKGYVLENIQWITMAENRRKYFEEDTGRIAIKKDGVLLGTYATQKLASQAIGVSPKRISRVLKQGKRKDGNSRTVNGYTVDVISF